MLLFDPIYWIFSIPAAAAFMPADYEVPALRRAHDILRVLAAARAPVRPQQLAQACDMPRSSLYLLLDSLAQRGWIEKVRDGYVVGLELMSLGAAYLRQDSLEPAFRTAAARFVERHNEVMQLAVLDGVEAVYLAREDARRPVRLVSEIGSRLPAHACALGKALLASLDDARLRTLLPAALPAVTERTRTDREALLAELAEVRVQGLAQDQEEVAAGLHCYAAYVGRTPQGKRVAVSTSLPTDRHDPAHLQAVQLALLQAARQIAARVGAQADTAD